MSAETCARTCATASIVHRRSAVATWSLRERPVCTFAPEVPETLGEHALDGRVNVLVRVLDELGLIADVGELPCAASPASVFVSTPAASSAPTCAVVPEMS